ncbi:MAG: hypothetical protein R2712_01485 [Vicinamibacterales bacterium]
MDEYARAELIAVVRQVRRRWRTKLAIRGAAGFLLAGVLAMVAIATGLDYFRFSPSAILLARVVTALLLVAGAVWFFVRPLLRKASDEQVAMYLEEHEPSLESTMLTAMAAPGDRAASPQLTERMIASAVERLRLVEDGARIEREPLRKFSLTVGAVSVAAILAFTIGPAILRQAVSALFAISRSLEAAAPIASRSRLVTPRCRKAPTRRSPPPSRASTRRKPPSCTAAAPRRRSSGCPC